jgi:hypothetical protein
MRSLRFLKRSEYADIVLSRTTGLSPVLMLDRHILKVGMRWHYADIGIRYYVGVVLKFKMANRTNPVLFDDLAI